MPYELYIHNYELVNVLSHKICKQSEQCIKSCFQYYIYRWHIYILFKGINLQVEVIVKKYVNRLNIDSNVFPQHI